MESMHRRRVAIGVIALSIGVVFWMLKKPEETLQPVQPPESKTVEERMVRRERTPLKRVPLPLPNLPLEEIKSNEEAHVVNSPNTSSAVISLVSEEALNYEDRLRALGELGNALSSEEIRQLLAFLRQPMPKDVEMSALRYYSLCNDLIETLLRQQTLPDGVGELLLDMTTNRTAAEVMRNYAIQFLPNYAEKLQFMWAETGASIDQEQLETIEQSLWSVMEERDNSNAGTALLSLKRLGRSEEQHLAETALALAVDEEASVANRVTALRLAQEWGRSEIIEVARELAISTADTMLRCAAISLVGQQGEAVDRAWLEEVMNAAQTVPVRTAAALALKRLSETQ